MSGAGLDRERAPRRTGPAGRRTPRMLAAMGAALLLGTVPAGHAAAAEDVESPGPQPYLPHADAEPVEGSASTADAPLIEAGAFYTDELEPDDELYYRVVLDDLSDYYLSAVAAPESGVKVAGNDGISLRLQTTGGDSCGPTRDRSFQSDDSARPIAISEWRPIDPDGNCQSADTYLLRLTRTSDGTSSPAAWPVELRVMAEPAVTGGETAAPPPRLWADPDDPPALPSGEATAVEGGTSFNDAQPIDEGVWRDAIAPGATHFYRVPVDWHQQLVVSTEFSNARTVEDSGTAFSGVLMEVYTPYRSPALERQNATYDGEPRKLEALIPPVSYDHRKAADDRYAERARVAGWHYIAVHLSTEVGGFLDQDTVPVTLRVGLAGEASSGPEYDGDIGAAGFGVSEEQRQQAQDGKSDETLAEEERGNRQLVGFAGIGAGVALLLVLGVWQLTAHRRAKGQGASSGPGGGYGGPGGGYGGPPPGGPPEHG